MEVGNYFLIAMTAVTVVVEMPVVVSVRRAIGVGVVASGVMSLADARNLISARCVSTFFVIDYRCYACD